MDKDLSNSHQGTVHDLDVLETLINERKQLSIQIKELKHQIINGLGDNETVTHKGKRYAMVETQTYKSINKGTLQTNLFKFYTTLYRGNTCGDEPSRETLLHLCKLQSEFLWNERKTNIKSVFVPVKKVNAKKRKRPDSGALVEAALRSCRRSKFQAAIQTVLDECNT